MPVRPDDVFRRPWKWRSILRDEALALASKSKVVVVSRSSGAQPVAEWFTPGSSFYSSSRPYLFQSLRYFLLTTEDEPEPAGVAQKFEEGGQAVEEPDDIPAGESSGPAAREEEEDPETMSANADQVAIAGVLTQAAQKGVPFCEECARAR